MPTCPIEQEINAYHDKIVESDRRVEAAWKYVKEMCEETKKTGPTDEMYNDCYMMLDKREVELTAHWRIGDWVAMGKIFDECLNKAIRFSHMYAAEKIYDVEIIQKQDVV